LEVLETVRCCDACRRKKTVQEIVSHR